MNEEQEAKKKTIQEIDHFAVWVFIYPASAFFFYHFVLLAFDGFLKGFAAGPGLILPFACFGAWLSGRSYYRAMKNAEGDSRQRTLTAIVWFIVRPVSFLICFFWWAFYGHYLGGYSTYAEQARFMLPLAILFSFGAWCHGYLFFKFMNSLKKN